LGVADPLSLVHLLCLEHVDNLGAYTASRPETGLLIPSDYYSCLWRGENGKGKVLSMRLLALLSAIAIGCTVATFAQRTLKEDAVLVKLSQPVYPPLARQANIQGDVIVAVTVHPDGKTEVAFESGHLMLKQAALDSAEQSQFECRECASTASIQLVYSFRLTKGRDCCSAVSVPAQATLEPPLSDQKGQRQTLITITAEDICLCDPASQLTKKSRSPKCLYLWKCS